MSAYLYRLFSIQSFKGEKVAIYVYDGKFPNAEILTDVSEIIEGTKTRKQIFKEKDWVYGLPTLFSGQQAFNRKLLTYYTRLMSRSQRIIDENDNIDKAIFVNSPVGKDWRGERALYYNHIFEPIKSDTPEYSACEQVGTITI